MVVRVAFLLLLSAVLLLGDQFKLYMKGGDYHMVREYKVQGDRVSYYSTERGDWEEIPVDLVDLKRTEAERKHTKEALQEQSKQLAEEDAAERALKKEIYSIPQNTGAYYLDGEQVKDLKMSDYKIVTDKKRQTLKYLSPIPIVPGKASVVIEGNHSSFLVKEARPTFYIRLAKEERFGIVKLTPKKTARIVENISIVPVANENVEEQNEIQTFQQQLQGGLFKVWPEKALGPGEYALVEYTQGEVSLMIWDFACTPGS
jgi:hypothetical protein